MQNFIWHNPRCSKSRQTLKLLEAAGVEFDIIHYLDQPPDRAAIRAACSGLDCSPLDILRSKEALFKDLGLSVQDPRSDEAWIEILATHPRLLERPIVCINDRYALGRPPENVQALL